jgi:hypothetical protein
LINSGSPTSWQPSSYCGPCDLHDAERIGTETQGALMHAPGPHNPSRKTTAVVVRLPQELREALLRRAATEDRTLASLLRLAAREYLDHTPGLRS